MRSTSSFTTRTRSRSTWWRTAAARDAEREARKQRGVPYAEFVSDWVTAEPPEHLPYYGSWGDDNSVIHATAWSTRGPVRVRGAMAELPPIYLPDPKDLALLHSRLRSTSSSRRLAELEPAAAAGRRAGLVVTFSLDSSLDAAAVRPGTPGLVRLARVLSRAKLLDGGSGALGIARRAIGVLRQVPGNVPLRRAAHRLRRSVRGTRARRPALPAAMAARTRPGFALRTLLADERTRTTSPTGAMTALGAADSATPVVLSMPSPARWLTIASQQAGVPATEPPDPALVENAAMYVADLLRIFAGARVDGLVLNEGPATEDDLADFEGLPAGAQRRRALRVARLGSHRRRRVLAPGSIEGVLGWFGNRPPAGTGGPWGIVLTPGPGLETGPLPSAGGGPALAIVPEAGDPELVMRWVRQLT